MRERKSYWNSTINEKKRKKKDWFSYLGFQGKISIIKVWFISMCIHLIECRLVIFCWCLHFGICLCVLCSITKPNTTYSHYSSHCGAYNCWLSQTIQLRARGDGQFKEHSYWLLFPFPDWICTGVVYNICTGSAYKICTWSIKDSMLFFVDWFYNICTTFAYTICTGSVKDSMLFFAKLVLFLYVVYISLFFQYILLFQEYFHLVKTYM